MRLMKALGLPLGVLVLGGQAFAADPIVIPEPEPMEYVRICDVYGAGFFYIPGTETCLKISGYVRYTIGATSDDGDATTTPNWYGFEPDGWNKQIRGRVNIDARSETEWGTLRSFIRLQGQSDNYDDGRGGAVGYSNDPDVGIDLAYIQLGGFAVGYFQSAFAGTFNGADSSDGTHSDDGLDFGDQYRMIVQYNFGGDEGFFATISLEEDDVAGVTPAGSWNYVPDVVAKAGFAGNWGTVWALAGWDEDNVHAGVAPGSSTDEFAVKAGLHLNIPQIPDASVRVIGLYSSGINSYWSTSEWSVMASYGQAITPNIFASIGAQYWSDLYVDNLGAPLGGEDAFSVEGSVAWRPVENFEIRTEANYIKTDGLDGSVGGYVWFLREF